MHTSMKMGQKIHPNWLFVCGKNIVQCIAKINKNNFIFILISTKHDTHKDYPILKRFGNLKNFFFS